MAAQRPLWLFLGLSVAIASGRGRDAGEPTHLPRALPNRFYGPVGAVAASVSP